MRMTIQKSLSHIGKKLDPSRVARIRENRTDPDPDPFRKIFTDPDPKRIRPISKNCRGIS